jgi:hypothetical protein
VPLDGVSAYLGNGYLACAGMPANAYAELVTTAFTVPPFNYDPLNFIFQYIIYSQDWWNGSMTSTQYDNFEVWIEDTTAGTPPEMKFRDGNKINDLGCKWWRVPGPETDSQRKTYYPGWATGHFDLKPYIDHTVKVYFRVYNRPDNLFNTYAFLDNVVIRVGPMP